VGVRTYSRADLDAAKAAWDAAEFSDEWMPFRELAAQRGILYPPSGTRWDSWEDQPPSQRAILVRAIRDVPRLLGECIRRSSSWSEVVSHLLDSMAEWREEVARAEGDDARRRREGDTTRGEARAAVQAIGGVMGKPSWEDRARTELAPRIASSAWVITINPGGDLDPKVALETGYAVLLDKPIVVVSETGRPVSRNLRRLATEVIELTAEPGTDAHHQELMARLAAITIERPA